MTQEKQSFWDHLDILREGVSKCMLICILMHFLYLMKKGPYFHKLGPLLLPKVFATLGKVKITLYFLHTKPDGSFSATNR